jgi:hypothetical protein
VAQSFAHDLMGLITFAIALLGMFALDGFLSLVIEQEPQPSSPPAAAEADAQ